MRELPRVDAAVIIPGHGPAWRDRTFLELEAKLFESIVSQVKQAERRGRVTVEEIQKEVDVEPLRAKFTHDDKDLDTRFRRYVGRISRTRRARPGTGESSNT